MLLGPGVLSTLRPSMAFCSSSRLVNLRLVTVAKLAATSTLSITTEYEGSGNRLELSLQALSQGFSFLGFSERDTPPPVPRGVTNGGEGVATLVTRLVILQSD